MMNMTNAVTYNQQLLPQLFSNMSQMNENINNLQQNMNAMTLANAATRNNNNNQQQQRNSNNFQQLPQGMPFQPPHQQMMPGPNTMFQQMPYCQPTNQQFPPPPPMNGFNPFQQQQNNRNNNRNANNNRNFGFGNGGQNQNMNKQKQKYYCWTHGVCNHPGIQCRAPAQGHQPYATFQNPMNGTMKGAGKYLNNY